MIWWVRIGRITVTILASLLVWAVFRGIDLMAGAAGDTGARGLYAAIVQMQVGGFVLWLIWGRPR